MFKLTIRIGKPIQNYSHISKNRIRKPFNLNNHNNNKTTSRLSKNATDFMYFIW